MPTCPHRTKKVSGTESVPSWVISGYGEHVVGFRIALLFVTVLVWPHEDNVQNWSSTRLISETPPLEIDSKLHGSLAFTLFCWPILWTIELQRILYCCGCVSDGCFQDVYALALLFLT